MNKNGLIAEIAERTGASKADIGRTIDAAIRVIRDTVSKRLQPRPAPLPATASRS
jgi:nucleoid DNA-binding protein